MMPERIILDVGCGTNRSYPFRPNVPINCYPIFMDIEVPVEELRRWDWVVADAQYLPFRDSCLDGIIASHVIEHLDNPLQFLTECRRALKKGGFAKIKTPNFMSRNAYLDPSHKYIFNFFRLWKLIRISGLIPHFPPPNFR